MQSTIVKNDTARQKGRFLAKLHYWFGVHPIILTVCVGLAITLIDEILSRRSVLGAFAFVFNSPHIFILNAFVVMLTMTPGLFTKRKRFFFCVIPLVWFIFGCVNFVMVGMRPMPFSAIDFLVVRSVRSIVLIYLSIPQILLICAGFIAVGVICVSLWKHSGHHPSRANIRHTLPFTFMLITVISIGSQIISDADALGSDNVGLMPEAYDSYGFVYCFSYSIFDWGINRPEDYSEDMISGIEDRFEAPAGAAQQMPNIVFLQLESFYDMKNISSLSFSQEVIPTFRKLSNEYSSGTLRVNTVGAGTANTEFEILTGMDLSDFSMGEYPYRTVLLENTCESVCQNLAPYGYTSHAIHNNTATFYDRNKVFPMLGFDTFTGIEYMSDLEYTASGWADDSVLTGSIMDCLESSDGSDFVFAIGVQPHGTWPMEGEELPIQVWEDGEKASYELSYFTNQLFECDQFIEELISELESYEEDTVLVIYGDHFPDLHYEDEDLLSGNVYQTEYVIWNNFGMEKVDKTLYTYQLYAEIMSRLGLEGGALTTLHNSLADEADYAECLSALEYDMLYGEQYIWDGKNPYKASQMHLGVYDAVIESAEIADGTITVKGQNFTPWSVIRSDKKRLETTFVDSCTLTAPFRSGSMIDIAQITDDRLILSVSEKFTLE